MPTFRFANRVIIRVSWLDLAHPIGVSTRTDTTSSHAASPRRMSTIAVGDIHGNRLPLEDVLRDVRLEVSESDTVVFLGDYIDRGAESKGCVDAILEFTAAVTASVVSLCGNHEDWMLRTRLDPTDHSWLFGMDGLTTIRSYSAEAAEAILNASDADAVSLHGGGRSLPYDVFWNAVPASHRTFFGGLRSYHETDDCVCVHAGLNPRIVRMQDQSRDALIWGRRNRKFPDGYEGHKTVLYGHRNNYQLDAAGWPWPKRVGRTIGLDSSRQGVLTAIRLPEDTVFQSRRHPL
jgi:serine/threonine protein phosphatase 1